MSQESRIDSEWVVVSAFREFLKIATKGDLAKSTYDDALEFGGELYPALLGREASLIRRARESDTTKEYRQRAMLRTQKSGETVTPLELLLPDIDELEDLLKVAAQNRKDRGRVDQLKRRLKVLHNAQDELNPAPHSENQLIFRDVGAVTHDLPAMSTGKGYRDFQLPDTNILRVRVLHPDKPEQVSGADIIYERHNPYEQEASVVAVQYKIWENRTLRLSDSRMQEQLRKLEKFTCESGLCAEGSEESSFRFPHCAAFLRPTDKLQRSDQKLISSGEHLPLCKIDVCTTMTSRGTPVLEYKNMRNTSISSEAFEYLFNTGKVGSRMLTYEELVELYAKFEVSAQREHVVIHAQEFADAW
ncbi:MAG: hypothetical protein WBV94_04100 [Blastocatellia bacterium]